MIVVRLEDDKGIGPYQNYGPALGLGLHTAELHPEPIYDIPRWKHVRWDKELDYLFAFDSIESLRDWFDDRSLVALYSKGYKVTVYRVPRRHVLIGNKQLAFKKVKAEKINQYININLNSDTLV